MVTEFPFAALQPKHFQALQLEYGTDLILASVIELCHQFRTQVLNTYIHVQNVRTFSLNVQGTVA